MYIFIYVLLLSFMGGIVPRKCFCLLGLVFEMYFLFSGMCFCLGLVSGMLFLPKEWCLECSFS